MHGGVLKFVILYWRGWFCGLAGLCFMGSTNALDQGQASQAGFHGQENLQMKKPNLFFLLVSLMAPNGSNCNHQRSFLYNLTNKNNTFLHEGRILSSMIKSIAKSFFSSQSICMMTWLQKVISVTQLLNNGEKLGLGWSWRLGLQWKQVSS